MSPEFLELAFPAIRHTGEAPLKPDGARQKPLVISLRKRTVGRFHLLVQIAELRGKLFATAKLLVQLDDGIFEIHSVVELFPFEHTPQDEQTVLVRRLGGFEIADAVFPQSTQRNLRAAQRDRHSESLRFSARKIL